MSTSARQVISFFLGFAGLVHQTVVAPQPEPILVTAFMTLIVGEALTTAFRNGKDSGEKE